MAETARASMSILQEADSIINGERARDYGPAKENHERIAALWSELLGVTVTWQQVVMCMVALKLARLANTPDHKDSWQDIAGYAGVWDKAQRGE